MSQQFDVVVIGAGPGGYVAAIRSAQLGFKTACIDGWVDAANKASPGGTCLNVGCIPSKAMIESSELYERAQHEFEKHGIKLSSVKLELDKMLARKDQVVRELTQGVAALFQANKITFFHGMGQVSRDKTIRVNPVGKGDVQHISAKNIIIATGSRPREMPQAPYDHKHIVDSTGALSFDSVPKKLGIIGAGVIALELGSVWRRLGAEVFLLKSSKSFLPEADQQIAKEAKKYFDQQGVEVRMGAKIKTVEVKANKVDIKYDDEKGSHSEKVDKLIVAIGRSPNSEEVFADDLKSLVDERGFIVVDGQCRTSINGIYAIGDVVRGPMLAHKASEEGVMVAEIIAGEHAHVDLNTVPSVIYTDPEIAWVGKTEDECKKQNIEYRIGTFPFSGCGRARAINNTKGLIKIIAHAKTDRVLGVHIIGPQASEIIAQAKIAIEFSASSEDLAMTMFAHPTLSEAFHEAALSVHGRAIHAVQAKGKR
ncbi:MAG: dihydrolipoyl dehydrogenase [Gammaproteobacteria bacterium]|nr:dihydrolipoyl dehydrogenase [Gammaproteobacteria bacterium]